MAGDRHLFPVVVTFANNATESSIFSTQGLFYPVAMSIPAGWTAADVTFLGSVADPFGSAPAIGNMLDIHETDDGLVMTFKATAGKLMSIHQPIHTNWLALKSTAAQTSGPKSVTLMMRAID